MSAPPAAALQVCVGDVPVPPFLSGDASRPGIIERLMVDAGRQLGMQVELLRWPARRCFEQMRLGKVEAGVGAAVASNLQEFDFPGNPSGDPQLRVARTAIVLIKRQDAVVHWDGQRLEMPHASPVRVGARAGFRAATEAVRRLGLEPTQGPNQPLHVLRMLQLGRLDLAVLVHEEASTLLARQEFSNLTQLEPPLLVSDFFVMTIRQLPEAQRQQVQRWWELMAQWRDLPAYRMDPAVSP
ncbi:hypothetical protein H5407_01325 [Mitsuaria sp. WAJ17]|uniref:hypothetical protein n=1 Tax=Mitsuaria sp. WAJ17 TaxID=2761452 RepID=UPI0015FF281B|nr:hypothetical protein [Mitsuaria sp. WAJ17]MBB2483860.1 hypothetical protein [Mitsuaria sp. WAJ17]